MNKNLYSTIALLALLASGTVRAAQDQMYAGVAFSSGGNLIIKNEEGRFENTNKPTAFRLFGGYDFTDNIAIEAGYAHAGKFKFAEPASVELSAFYAAAKGSIALGESFSVFGKLGAARHGMEGSRLGASAKLHQTRPLIGIGVGYRINEHFSAALELTDYGTIKDTGINITMRKLEAGLNYHF